MRAECQLFGIPNRGIYVRSWQSDPTVRLCVRDISSRQRPVCYVQLVHKGWLDEDKTNVMHGIHNIILSQSIVFSNIL